MRRARIRELKADVQQIKADMAKALLHLEQLKQEANQRGEFEETDSFILSDSELEVLDL